MGPHPGPRSAALAALALLLTTPRPASAEAPAVVNGGFEAPTIAEAVAAGASGDGSTWAAHFDVPGWVDSEWSGYNRSMVVDGSQNFFWNDPVDQSLQQTIATSVVAEPGWTYAVRYFRRVDRSPGAIAAGKTIEFGAQLLVGAEVVDEEHVTDAVGEGLRTLVYTTDGAHPADDPVTLRFWADASAGWTGGDQIQSVLVDAVAVSLAPFQEGPFLALGLDAPVVPPPDGPTARVWFPDGRVGMHFDPPGTAAYVVDGQIGVGGEFAETSVAGECFEVGFDPDATMWVESQHRARIVVRYRGALRNAQGAVAHTDLPSGSPYGAGDWADEWFYVYPDGTSVRRVLIYTGAAPDAVAFWGRPGTVFETQESFVYGLLAGHQPIDDISTEAVTLATTGGLATTVSWLPYPPDADLFPGASVQIVNLSSALHPFTAVPAGDVEVRPYYGPAIDHQYVAQTVFVAWPRVPYFDNGYTAALTHVVSWDWFERTETTLAQVYLLGLTDLPTEGERVARAAALARSWQDAPPLECLHGTVTCDGYSLEQRAYLLTSGAGGPATLTVRLDASPSRPVVNPCLVVRGWASAAASAVAVDGVPVPPGPLFREGVETGAAGTSRVIWLALEAEAPVEIRVDRREGGVLFADGFDSGDVSAWDGSVGSSAP